MNLKKSVSPLLVFLAAFLFSFFKLPACGFAGTLSITLTKETLSLSAEQIPLQDILLEIARHNITVKIDPQINPLITADFENRTIEAALEALIRPASYSLIWESRTGNSDEKSLRLAEIQIFRSARRNLIQPLVPKRPTAIVKDPDGSVYVKDELILYLPAGTDIRELKKLITEYRATLLFTGKLPGPARIILPPESDILTIAAELKKRLELDIAQPNYAYPLQPPVIYKDISDLLPDGSGVNVSRKGNVAIAILDSGLGNNTPLDKLVVSSIDILNPDTSITDSLGHGTQMAYIASGLVKPYGLTSDTGYYAPIIPIRVFDDSGYTTDYNIMSSINFALDNNARVMSLSWGSETRSDFIEKIFDYARGKGLVIVASAGNEPTGNPVYPAAYPSVIGIGALEPHGKTWENSNYGSFVSFYAPGFANLPVGYNGKPGMYAGTSIATALVAHSIAEYLTENPTASMQEITDYLDKSF